MKGSDVEVRKHETSRNRLLAGESLILIQEDIFSARGKKGSSTCKTDGNGRTNPVEFKE